MQKKNLKNNGFTLIEVLVAMVLLLIMSLGTLYGISRSMTFITQNQYREQAKQIGQLRMDVALKKEYDELFVGTTNNDYSRFFGDSQKIFTVAETVTQEFANIKKITVIITWDVLGEKESLTLTSIRGNR